MEVCLQGLHADGLDEKGATMSAWQQKARPVPPELLPGRAQKLVQRRGAVAVGLAHRGHLHDLCNVGEVLSSEGGDLPR